MSTTHPNKPPQNPNSKKTWIGIVVVALFILALWLLSDRSANKTANADSNAQARSADSEAARQASLKKTQIAGKHLGEEWPPQLKVIFTYDSVTVNGKTRSLVAKQRDSKFIPNTDSPSGFDLWVTDENGHERLVDSSVYRAKFSPDGTKIAYGTSDATLRVEDLQGNRSVDINGAYDPNWKPDGSAVVFAKVPPGRPNMMPGVLQVAVVDPATSKVTTLTDGTFDDVMPVYDPTGKNILFVSGGRSGLASFWVIRNPGEPPVQITNLGQESVDENFVPTPYSPHTLWSKNGQWFIYDFKQGDREQTWGLKFDGSGNAKPVKLADGTQPQWKIEGQSFVCQTADGKMVEATLP
ncbi:MAG: putative lipoprotein [Verrucomicrobiales bacterium]|nr:putative lipoprotein [Verrucomicrobiales bacterium]